MDYAQEKKLNDLFDQYVPESGPAQTKGGEIVRAVERIAYRWYNDGDEVWSGYGLETVTAPYMYLRKNLPNTPDVDHVNYEDFIDRLITTALGYFEYAPQVFKTTNMGDCLERDKKLTDYIRWYEAEEDPDYWDC